MVRCWTVIVCASLVVGIPPAGAGGGNSGNAKLCQDSWQTLRRADTTEFKNQGACVSYAAQGGTLSTFTTSTTSHATQVRVDLSTINLYVTRIFAQTNSRVVYDVTLSSPPGSAEAAAAFQAASQALNTELSQAGSGQIVISGPNLQSSTESIQTEFVGEQLDHTEVSITTTTTVGPAQIFVGPARSQAFSVAAGTVNVDTNTHTETFFDEQYQTTVVHSATYLLTGSIV